MYEDITLDMLTQNSVSVKKQKYYNDGNINLPLGLPHRKAFVNSDEGRNQVQAQISEPHRSAIFSVWGSSPTVFEVP